jgi:ATP-dependent DNA helicase DinG
MRKELGVPKEALEIVVDSPFNFERQVLMVVPEGMPEPRDPSYEDKAVQVFRQVIEACEGRTLGLFTSYKSLNAVYARICHGPYKVMKQGILPRTELTKAFKEDVSSVLLGTSSFWTGIDVPGEALTALVIWVAS